MVSDLPREHGGHLLVWSWWAHDSRMGTDLVFAVAVSDRAALAAVCRRVGIGHAGAERTRPGQPGFAAALRQPGQLVWTPLDRFASPHCPWADEQQLAAARGTGLAGRHPDAAGKHPSGLPTTSPDVLT